RRPVPGALRRPPPSAPARRATDTVRSLMPASSLTFGSRPARRFLVVPGGLAGLLVLVSGCTVEKPPATLTWEASTAEAPPPEAERAAPSPRRGPRSRAHLDELA